MPSTPRDTPAGAKPTLNGFISLPDTLAVAETLKAAITLFASEDGFRSLSQLIDEIPKLEKDNVRKEQEIRNLAAQVAAGEERNIADQQKQLRIYNDAYDTWKTSEAAFQGEIHRLNQDVQNKEQAIATFQEEVKRHLGTKSELDRKVTAATAKVKEKDRKIADLTKQLDVARTDAASATKQLGQSRTQLLHLQESSKEKAIELDNVKEKLNIAKGKVQEVIKLSAPLKDLDLESFPNEFENLWKHVTLLVEKFIMVDLPQEMLQNGWPKLRENKLLIPVPQSNSDIAKQMRIAAVLGILARLIDHYIFQPTYLLDEESGFRELLRRQATVDQRKERFARGVVLSMFPEEQEPNALERIGCVLKDLFLGADIRAILARERVDPFAAELEKFLGQVYSTWQAVQYGKQRLEPDFGHCEDSNLQWSELELQVGAEADRPTSAVAMDDQDDEAVVIFPRIYLMEVSPKPITTGTVLRKAHLRAAAQEVRKTLSQGPFAHQRRGSRTVAIGENDERGGFAKNHFLSRFGASVHG